MKSLGYTGPTWQRPLAVAISESEKRIYRLAAPIAAALMFFGFAAETRAEESLRVHAGVLVCAPDTDWDSTISESKYFECTFSSTNGEVRGKYSAVIREFSIEAETIGSSVLVWQVAGPPEKIGDNYEPGGLAGPYLVTEDMAASDLRLRPETLVGMGPRSFTLQPVSVQFETGFSIAAGVKALVLNFVGPMTI